ncbi:MAG: thiamine pyrophosphate-binding protein [Anaerolineae bacterium]
MVLAANGLARILKQEGVEWVTTFPTCCVNNALGQEDVPIIMMRDERYAVAVADAYSRVTGGDKIGVCTVMGGINAAGLQMAYGALAQAFEDSSPVLCITDGVPPGAGGRGRYDMVEALGSVCKWVGVIDRPERVPEIMRRAFTALRTGRRAPVLVTIPRGMGEYDEAQYPYTPVKGWRSAPDPADVALAVDALLAARHPLLYAGEGVLYAHGMDALKSLAERAQLPVMTTLKGQSVFPGNHPLSVGVRGDLAAHFLRGCDLVLAVGTSLYAGHFRQAIPEPGKKTIVHCTDDPGDINRTYPTQYAVVGDARLTLDAILAELASRTPAADKPGLRAAIAEQKEAMLAKYRPAMVSDEMPINPYRVYADMFQVLDPEDCFITHDSGSTRDQLSTVIETHIERGFMGWGNVSTLGFGLAAAMAAKLAFPGRQVINVTGDAGVGYMLGNMEALVRRGIGVTTIHINNGGFAGYGPGFWGPGHDPFTCEVCEHSTADISRAVEALGYYAEDVTEPDGIIPALERALAQNAQSRPAYLEFICSQYPVFGGWVTG